MYNLPGCLLLTPCPRVPNSRMRGALKPSLPMRETRLPKEDKEIKPNQTKPNIHGTETGEQQIQSKPKRGKWREKQVEKQNLRRKRGKKPRTNTR